MSQSQVAGDEFWSDQFVLSGLNGGVTAMVVYKGDLIVAGAFTQAGGVQVNNIARWDGVAWWPLGAGLNSYTYSLAVYGTNLVAGGVFTEAGGQTASRVAQWDGETWAPMNSGMRSGVVYALTAYDGDLVAGGSFAETDSGVFVNNVARWDGVSWAPLGAGTDNTVWSLAANGVDLWAGGDFTSAGGFPADHIARWDGATWSPLGSGVNATVRTLAIYGTDLILGGDFSYVAGDSVRHIVRWDGATWSAMGGLTNGGVSSLGMFGSELIATGGFTQAGGVSCNHIARWDGVSWAPLGSGISWAGSLAEYNSHLVVGGITQAGSLPVNRIARWTGSTWQPLGTPLEINGPLHTLLPWNSELQVGGDFTTAGTRIASRVAGLDGTGWNPYSTGANLSVRCLSPYGSDLVAGGLFTTAGGVSAKRIVRWDGNEWRVLGSGMNERVLALAASGADLYAGGAFTQAGGFSATYIARWDGSSWSPLQTGMNNTVAALTMHDSALVAGGVFTVAGGVPCERLARWNGTTWSAMPGMNGPVQALGHFGGQLVAGGTFTTAGGAQANNIAIFDGTNWSPLGSGTNGSVLALVEAGGRLFVGGDFSTAGGGTASYVAVWDGAEWSPMGSGTNGTVRSLAYTDPYLFVGGDFTTSGMTASSYIARWDGLLGPCSMAVTQPTDGSLVCAGGPVEIRWTFTGVCAAYVRIELLRSGLPCEVIAATAPNTGVYYWAASQCSTMMDDYSIRVTDLDSGVTAGSIGAFAIAAPGAIAVTLPNGGERLVAGVQTQLTWDRTSCAGSYVKLELLQQGAPCLTVSDSTLNSGLHVWLPEQCQGVADGYRLRVTDLDSGDTDSSDSDFVIGPAYRILTVTDVGNDQGRRVRLRWLHADYDAANADTVVTEYSVWRRVEPSLVAASGGLVSRGGIPERFQASVYPPGNWDFVTTVPAMAEQDYGVVCETLCDSTIASGACWSTFFVRAHTTLPWRYYDTLPDSGYSVDNVPPPPPDQFAGICASGATHLHWGASEEPDLWYYRIYRGATAGFEPGPSTLIAARNDTGYVDAGYCGSFYKLSAVDVSGNESAYSVLSPDGTVGVGGGAAVELRLEGAWPNPVRGGGFIVGFALPDDGAARLELFDVNGRRLTNRDVGALGRGFHRVDLVASSHLQPGVYLVRLVQGSRSRSVRVAVIN